MSSRITYEDKKALQNDETVARKNKVTDLDMNEIKEVVNAHADDIESFENYDDTAIKADIANIKAEQETQNTDIEALQTSISEINEKNDTQDLELAKLQQENIELKKTQDDMIEKSLNKETEADTSLIVKDADEFYGKLSVFGGQRQKKREGINFINTENLYSVTREGVEITPHKDGSITLNGTAAAAVDYTLRSGTLSLKTYTYKCFGLPGEIASNLWFVGDVYGEATGKIIADIEDRNYTIKLKIPAGTTINATIRPMLIAGEYTDETFPEFEAFGVMPSLNYPSEIECVGGEKAELELGTIASATGTNNTSDRRVRTKDYIRVIANTECTIDADNVEEVVVFQYDENKTKILATSWLELPYSFILDKNTRYIRYAFRCSDDSVLTVDEVKDKSKWLSSIEINTSNKNICQSQAEFWELGMYNSEAGQKVAHSSRARCKELTPVTSSTEIYFNTFNNEYSFVVRTYDENKAFINSIGEKINGTKLVLNSNVKYISNTIMRKNASGSSGEGQAILDKIASGEIKPFICLSSEADKTFVEHRGETHIMPIQQPMLKGDYFDIENKKEVHLWKRRVFDGTEDFGMDSSNKSFYVQENRAKRLTNYKDKMFCNCYSSIENFEKGITGVSGYHRSGSFPKQNWIYFTDENYADATSFKAMLAQKYAEGNPVYVVYTLATPTLLKCTEEQSKILDKIDTYRDTTIITTDNDLCKISLRYKQDLESRVAEIEKQIVGGN